MLFSFFFFFNDTATTEIYTLSLHDALPTFVETPAGSPPMNIPLSVLEFRDRAARFFAQDRKSTRLNSSHVAISYAVFCLKKKKKTPGRSPRSPPRSPYPTRS